MNLVHTVCLLMYVMHGCCLHCKSMSWFLYKITKAKFKHVKFCWDCGVGLQSITTSVLLPVFKLSRPDCKANELINGVLTLAYLTSTLPVVTLCYLDQWAT